VALPRRAAARAALRCTARRIVSSTRVTCAHLPFETPPPGLPLLWCPKHELGATVEGAVGKVGELGYAGDFPGWVAATKRAFSDGRGP